MHVAWYQQQSCFIISTNRGDLPQSAIFLPCKKIQPKILKQTNLPLKTQTFLSKQHMVWKLGFEGWRLSCFIPTKIPKKHVLPYGKWPSIGNWPANGYHLFFWKGRVFLSRDYRLIVDDSYPATFDVLKQMLGLIMLTLWTSNFQGATFSRYIARQKYSNVVIVHQQMFFRPQAALSNLQSSK